MDFEDIAALPNLQSWIEKKRSGSHAFLPYHDPRRDLDEDDRRRVGHYQVNSLVPDLADLRRGYPETRRLALFRLLIEDQHDANNFVVFRGLGLDQALQTGQSWLEPTISSWSLYPHKALEITGFSGRQKHVVLLRDRIRSGEASMYVYETEEEVLRPPVERIVTRCYDGEYQSNHGLISVQVADLGVA